MQRTISHCALLVIAAVGCAWGQRQVAITFDDLPRGGDAVGSATSDREMTIKLLTPFQQQHLPLTGFVNECHHTDELRGLLKLWIAAGAELGNHTCSHLDLNSASLAEFETDITKGEAVTTDVMGRPPRFFRYPFLHTGQTLPVKDKIALFVKQRGYIMAPVTLDNDDYVFARLYADKLAGRHNSEAARVLATYVKYMESIFMFFEHWGSTVTGHELRQILLVHASQLNADAMPQLLRMILERGYEVIPLGEALTDEAYQLREEYVGPMGISWIHRWAMAKDMTVQQEPEAPEWVTAAYKQLSNAANR